MKLLCTQDEILDVLEDSENPSDPEDLDDSADVVKGVCVGVGLDEKNGDKVRQDGEDINDVHGSLDKGPFLRSPGQPQHVLDSEPSDADGLDHGQVRVVGGLTILVCASQRGQGVDGHANGGDDDEGDGDDADDLEDRQVKGVGDF